MCSGSITVPLVVGSYAMWRRRFGKVCPLKWRRVDPADPTTGSETFTKTPNMKGVMEPSTVYHHVVTSELY